MFSKSNFVGFTWRDEGSSSPMISGCLKIKGYKLFLSNKQTILRDWGWLDGSSCRRNPHQSANSWTCYVCTLWERWKLILEDTVSIPILEAKARIPCDLAKSIAMLLFRGHATKTLAAVQCSVLLYLLVVKLPHESREQILGCKLE